MSQTSISLSPVEEKRFGYRTARAFLQEKADLPLINEFCRKEKIDFLILRCETAQINLVHALEENNFSLMDTLLYFRYIIPQEKIISTTKNTSVSQLKDERRLVEITEKAFSDYQSHFHVDPRLDIKKSREAYLDWASRSCRKETADEVLVAKSNGKINGFLTLRKNSATEAEGPLFAVSPQAQGQGLGKDLMSSAFKWAYEQGSKKFIISTQITNLASQNLWTSLGMKLYRSLYTFHKWFDK